MSIEIDTYYYTELKRTTEAVTVLQEFELFLKKRGATLEGDIKIEVTELGDAYATVKMFFPVVLLDECTSQSQKQGHGTQS